jgi:Tfp pilus assembly protein PilZ
MFGEANMNVSEGELKKYNVVIPKLFQLVLNLPVEKQSALLKYAEDLLTVERRAYIRKSCSIPVNYATYDRFYTDTIKNISQRGVFIVSQRPLFVGEEIVMSFSIDGFDKPLKIKGEIVQVNRNGIGVEFKDMSPYVDKMLAKLIERMEEDPA